MIRFSFTQDGSKCSAISVEKSIKNNGSYTYSIECMDDAKNCCVLEFFPHEFADIVRGFVSISNEWTESEKTVKFINEGANTDFTFIDKKMISGK